MSQLPDQFIQELLEDMSSKAIDYAKKKGNATAMREARKMQKAQLMRVAENMGIKAIGNRESFAYSHPEYKIASDREVAADEAETLAYWMLKMKEIEWDSWRTISANARKI